MATNRGITASEEQSLHEEESGPRRAGKLKLRKRARARLLSDSAGGARERLAISHYFLRYFGAMIRPAYCLLALACCVPAAAQQVTVAAHTLSNGMKVLIHEDHDVPNVAMYFFYKVGSRNERPGTTGMSHFFEHMMFNGAKKYGPKQFDIQMEKAGGRNNAYTTQDVTVYTDWFPTSALDLMFDMEADRIRDLAFDPKMIESERGVVYSERRSSVDNSNNGILREHLNATAFLAHPYGWPVLGWPSDIENWTIEDLKQHFRMGYAPNNCVLVLSGDVTEAEALRLARKYLEPIPRQNPPPPVRTAEPEQIGERRVTVRKAAQLPLLMLSYHVPSTQHADHRALEMLAAVLSRGRSSRLYRRLVDQDQLTLGVNAFKFDSLDPNLFGIYMQVRAGKDPVMAEKAVYEELEKVSRDGITDAELAKARNQMLVELYDDFKTIAGKANLIGSYEVFYGDHRRINSASAELEKVTAADVKRVTAAYFSHKNRTVAVLVPESAPEKKGASQ
jgi:zinc protease